MRAALNPALLYSAYSQGYFPMPDEAGDGIAFYRPDPRAVLPLDAFHVSRSLKKVLKRQPYRISFDEDFAGVIAACANRPQTWINAEFQRAYCELFHLGLAHSVEVWEGSLLVGGSYGVHFGAAFFAESMFHRQSNASKIALYYLCQHLRTAGFLLLECQFMTEHLRSLGVQELSDSDYMTRLAEALAVPAAF